ncbi:MAG: 2-phosphosulfolactate phosphatase [Phycisphaeraceae bacterium]|nr:2-phosphosulfolactate phosphatase [Phycisphaeraceae bacterium]MCW5753901.1 2-phosphosulfolactate phosphatase [Phycisphaeraceae bacterium]
MPAPDLPPLPSIEPADRTVGVILHPRMVDPAALAGSITIVIDNLRASVTIAAALHAGAVAVHPCLTVEDARAQSALLQSQGMPRSNILLGGERGGRLIDGFDLDNSPAKYTTERVAGRTLVFTTTNGTAALLHAAGSGVVLVGSLANVAAVTDAVAEDPRPVYLLCAGTRDAVTLDDCLAAGAFADALIRRGRQFVADDSALLCRSAYLASMAQAEGLFQSMLSSRGGRNLLQIGLEADVEFCSRCDHLPVVPRFYAQERIIRLQDQRG